MELRNLSDTLLFFKAWLFNPLSIGALMPSGRALANLITSEISTDTGLIIELGPGTGVFTHALIERGIDQKNIALIENDAAFVTKLQHRFGHAHTFCIDASRLHEVEFFDGAHAGAVVSGLPMLSMSPRKMIAILDGAFAKMRPEGSFYQFTYGPRCPIPRTLLDRLGLKAMRVGRILVNVPPATVYRIVRRKPRPAASGERIGVR
ncbi:hypothetical protein EHLJMEHL_00675 [Vreelandella titanicae]